MTDPESQVAHAARERRRWELIAELEKGGDSIAILAEMSELDAADEQYTGRLLNKVEVDHALRRGQVAHQYDGVRELIAAKLPSGDPTRRALERLLRAAQSNEPLSDEDESALRAFGIGADVLNDLRASHAERAELDRKLEALDGGE